jgi:hypothetical protein
MPWKECSDHNAGGQIDSMNILGIGRAVHVFAPLQSSSGSPGSKELLLIIALAVVRDHRLEVRQNWPFSPY